MRTRAVLVLMVALVGILSGLLRAEQDASDALLKEKGLTRVGLFYLLDGDLNVGNGLRAMRKARAQLDAALNKRAEAEKQVRATRAALAQLYAQFQNVSNRMAGMKPAPGTYNDLVNQSNILSGQIREGERILEDQEKALSSFAVPTDEYVAAVAAVSDEMEKTQHRYEQLAADLEVTAAVARINAATHRTMRLGPSERFTTELRSVRHEREKFDSATIKLEIEGGVPTVTVTLNGTVQTRMVLDSGAAYVSLNFETAKELGLRPLPSDPKLPFTVADGRSVNASIKSLESIQLGQFVAENVECAILPKGADGGNLLGGSFLSHFVYRMDLGAGELHLSQIGGATTRPAIANSRKPKPDPTATSGTGAPAEKLIPDNAVNYGDHTFAVIDGRYTWLEAERKCEEMGGHLAKINDKRELNFLHSVRPNVELWVGARDPQHTRRYIWLDGTPVFPGLWRPGEPSGFPEDVVILLSGGDGLNDVVATSKHGFICEWDQPPR